jgi:Transposase protein
MAQALVQYEHRHPLGDREDLVALLDRVVDCDDPGLVAARWLSRLDLVELGALPVLPDPVARDGERALARFGLLGEGAASAFAPGARYPLAGLLLALPALADTGLLACARTVYGRLRNGFYGLETMLVMLVFCARLNDTQTRYPGTTLTLRTKSKNTQALHWSVSLCREPSTRVICAGHGTPGPRGVGLELGLRCLRSSSRRSC